ncbi:MAG: DUF433 domain-containing protein [Chloroflexota bacterium]|nr:DUF433 domain-containing protein [Chloroflexota bacterium]
MTKTPDVVTQHIVTTPGTAGGKPRIAGRRITVQQIALWHERLGMSPDEIVTAYDLTLGDIYAALAYYHDHRPAIDAAMQADNALVAELRQRTPSRLKARVGGSACSLLL